MTFEKYQKSITSGNPTKVVFAKDQLHLKLGPKAKYWRYTAISTLDSLVELRLHRPVDVNIRREVLRDAQDLCFTNGVVFVAERGSSAIRFIELKGEVLFKPGRLKSRADLLSQLSRFRLSLEGTGPVLQKRLTTHLRSLAAQVENKQIVQINPTFK